MISAIVLAAGLARRFGSPKTLALYDGKALVRHVVERVAATDVVDIVVVVPAPEAPYAESLAQAGVRIVVNERPADGLSGSLRLGLRAVDPRTQAILVALADQPTIERDVVDRIIGAWRDTHASIVAPSYRGQRGHPVLFDVALAEELQAVTGDRGAREVIERDASRVHLVPIDREAPKDVDTPEDLAALGHAHIDRTSGAPPLPANTPPKALS